MAFGALLKACGRRGSRGNRELPAASARPERWNEKTGLLGPACSKLLPVVEKRTPEGCQTRRPAHEPGYQEAGRGDPPICGNRSGGQKEPRLYCERAGRDVIARLGGDHPGSLFPTLSEGSENGHGDGGGDGFAMG